MPDGSEPSPPDDTPTPSGLPPSQPPRPDYGQQPPGNTEGWGFPPAYLDSPAPAPVVSKVDTEQPPTDFDG